MTDPKLYLYWQAELSKPGLMSRDTTDPVDGFWRINAAKTKADHPVAIWHEGGSEIIQIGRSTRHAGASAEADDFRSKSWMHCQAVTQEAYNAALETGFWSDGKPSRRMSDEEKMGIDTGSGDNNAPLSESLADQIAALADKINKTAEPTTQDQANALSGMLDKMRALLKLAEAERVKEKQPFLDGGKEVDQRWQAIGEPGGNAYRDGEARRKAFLKKLQDKLDAEARAERKRQQDAVDAENDRIRKENQKRMDEAHDFGGVDGSDLTVEPPELLPEVAAPAIEAPRAKIGRAHV